MKLSNHSAVPVYTISGSSTARPLPEWLARKRKRSLKNDAEYANRVELLQDFEFEEASHCIRVSEDGDWVMSTGTYKPQIHTHYLPHLSLSFARHTTSLNTTFLLLSSDYSKSLHLQSDRSLEFHAPSGCHYTTRLPRYGRDLQYDRRSAEVLIPAVDVNENGNGEVFRLNLELGRYMKGYEVDVGGDDFNSVGGGALQGGIGTGAVNTAAVAEESHNLLAFGTSLGTIEFWDPRSRERAALLQSPTQADVIDGRQEITALEFDRSGLGLASGSSTGLIHLYDLRSSRPVLKKDQGYGYPIQTLIYLSSTTSGRSQSSEPKILSADKRIIKIWNPEDGSPWTSVEPAVDLNCVTWCKDSGMLLTANEGRQQHSFFIPQLGPAPRWCSFLDNLVEEMVEDPNDPNAFTSQKVGEVYDNYKFLTLQQLETLNLSHLIGTTSLLRPYMHGYFVAQRLYEEAKLIANPFVWEDERNKRVKEKIDSERESRIRGNKKVAVKVNKRLAEKMLWRQEKAERRRAQRVLEKGGDDEVVNHQEGEQPPVERESNGLLTDPRFAKLFQDENFAIDETSREFQMLNPSTKPTLNSEEKRERKLTAVEEEALDEERKSNSNSDSEPSSLSEKEANSAKTDKGRISSTSYKKSGHRRQQPQICISSSKDPRRRNDRSFGDRAERTTASKPSTGTVVGEREITFAPERKKKGASRTEKPERRKTEGRRSASGNVFRNM
ncbi:MAG: hypothetical protein LQ343_004790 [Gyalolechia ehrenbergii]|nr:MAG: hypothetical protein LQ343_004790 [Gyalolechia ehrenbergii]